MRPVGPRGVHQRSGVEMPEMMLNESGNRPGWFGLFFCSHVDFEKFRVLHDTIVRANANPKFAIRQRRAKFLPPETFVAIKTCERVSVR